MADKDIQILASQIQELNRTISRMNNSMNMRRMDQSDNKTVREGRGGSMNSSFGSDDDGGISKSFKNLEKTSNSLSEAMKLSKKNMGNTLGPLFKQYRAYTAAVYDAEKALRSEAKSRTENYKVVAESMMGMMKAQNYNKDSLVKLIKRLKDYENQVDSLKQSTKNTSELTKERAKAINDEIKNLKNQERTINSSLNMMKGIPEDVKSVLKETTNMSEEFSDYMNSYQKTQQAKTKRDKQRFEKEIDKISEKIKGSSEKLEDSVDGTVDSINHYNENITKKADDIGRSISESIKGLKSTITNSFKIGIGDAFARMDQEIASNITAGRDTFAPLASGLAAERTLGASPGEIANLIDENRLALRSIGGNTATSTASLTNLEGYRNIIQRRYGMSGQEATQLTMDSIQQMVSSGMRVNQSNLDRYISMQRNVQGMGVSQKEVQGLLGNLASTSALAFKTLSGGGELSLEERQDVLQEELETRLKLTKEMGNEISLVERRIQAEKGAVGMTLAESMQAQVSGNVLMSRLNELAGTNYTSEDMDLFSRGVSGKNLSEQDRKRFTTLLSDVGRARTKYLTENVGSEEAQVFNQMMQAMPMERVNKFIESTEEGMKAQAKLLSREQTSGISSAKLVEDSFGSLSKEAGELTLFFADLKEQIKGVLGTAGGTGLASLAGGIASGVMDIMGDILVGRMLLGKSGGGNMFSGRGGRIARGAGRIAGKALPIAGLALSGATAFNTSKESLQAQYGGEFGSAATASDLNTTILKFTKTMDDFSFGLTKMGRSLLRYTPAGMAMGVGEQQDKIKAVQLANKRRSEIDFSSFGNLMMAKNVVGAEAEERYKQRFDMSSDSYNTEDFLGFIQRNNKIAIDRLKEQGMTAEAQELKKQTAVASYVAKSGTSEQKRKYAELVNIGRYSQSPMERRRASQELSKLQQTLSSQMLQSRSSAFEGKFGAGSLAQSQQNMTSLKNMFSDDTIYTKGVGKLAGLVGMEAQASEDKVASTMEKLYETVNDFYSFQKKTTEEKLNERYDWNQRYEIAKQEKMAAESHSQQKYDNISSD